MTRSMSVLLVGGVVVLSGVTACGSGDGPPAASGSTSGSASASASSSGTPSAPAPAEAKERASAATKKALLPSAAFAKIGLEVDKPPTTERVDWFETCRPTLPSESRQVTSTYGKWSGEGVVVSQTVAAYPDGVAEGLVDETRKAVTCDSYTAGGKDFSEVKAFELDKVPSADAVHAWCVVADDDDRTICHSVMAAKDLVSSLWVASPTAKEARNGLAKLTVLAAARIDAQVS